MTFLLEDKGKYEKSLEAILSGDPSENVRKEIRRIINRKDTLGNTALHYATMVIFLQWYIRAVVPQHFLVRGPL